MTKNLIGKIISNKLAHTVTVRVSVSRLAPKYGKILRLHKKVLAHVDADKNPELGTKVVVAPCRKISKLKFFKVVEIKSI